MGLTLAGFLVLLGLTGALIVWSEELDRVLAADLYRRPPAVEGRGDLDPFTLRERVLAQASWAFVDRVEFGPPRAGEAMMVRLRSEAGAPRNAPDQVFVDPATGAITGARRSADLRDGPKAWMGFIYALHENLALGEWGTFVFGVVALIWTADCFVGFWLTLPPSRRAARQRAPAAIGKSWWARWRPAWLVRLKAGAYRLNFDLHRASGLWLWPLLLLFAWSGVSFNLYQVYRPVTAAALGLSADIEGNAGAPDPAIGWRRGYALARTAMSQQARVKGFAVRREWFVRYIPPSGLFEYRVSSDRDVSDGGETAVLLDGRTGALAGVRLGAGAKPGDAITTWIGDLHEALVLGLAWRIVVTLVGLGVAALSVTGVIVWERKRRSRLLNRRKLKGTGRRAQLTHRKSQAGPDLGALRTASRARHLNPTDCRRDSGFR